MDEIVPVPRDTRTEDRDDSHGNHVHPITNDLPLRVTAPALPAHQQQQLHHPTPQFRTVSVVVAPQQPLPAHPTQPAAPFVVVAGHATSEPAAASSTDSLRLLTEKLSSLALEGSGHVGGGSYDELLRSLADKSRENVTLSVALRKQQTDVARLTQLEQQCATHQAALNLVGSQYAC